MKKVRVYWNLHRKCWSIQDCKSGLVIDHKAWVVLEGNFVVRKGGQKRVRQEGKKNVHAFAEGWYPSTWISPKHYHEEGREVTYNPYKNDTFVWKDTGDPVSEESITMVKLTIPRGGRPRVQAYS